MTENVRRFFELYNSDPSLRQRISDAAAAYPGSLEIRDALVQEVLLPAASELGLDFTLAELRAYETRRKLEHSQNGEYDDSFEGYWLLDRGWSSQEASFCGDKKAKQE